MLRVHMGQFNWITRPCAGKQDSACRDAVRDHLSCRPFKGSRALYLDYPGRCPDNLATRGIEEFQKRVNLWLQSCIRYAGSPLRCGRRNDQVRRRPNTRKTKMQVGTIQSSMTDLDSKEGRSNASAQRAQTLYMNVKRARTDWTASREGKREMARPDSERTEQLGRRADAGRPRPQRRNCVQTRAVYHHSRCGVVDPTTLAP